MNPMALEYLETHYNFTSPKINIRRQQKLQSGSQCKLANKDISFVTLWYISCLYLRLMCNHLQLTKVTVVYHVSHGIRECQRRAEVAGEDATRVIHKL
jgi:hypothetical protein